MAKNKIQLTSPKYNKNKTSSGSGKSSSGSSGKISSAGRSSGSGYRVAGNGHVIQSSAPASGTKKSTSGSSGYSGTGGGYGKVSSSPSGGTGGSTRVIYNPGGSTGSTGTAAAPSYSASVDYHKQASDAAARGDWAAVEQALNARQAKINAQGGNDRGTSNAQILSQLKSQYGGSYGGLSSGTQDRLSLAAGEKLPFTNYQGEDGSIYKDKGWQDGVDYLARASEYARNGDLDGAYDALMRRGFKLHDTGSAGGGTSQDQAYALIRQLYSQSAGAQQAYQNKLAANAQALRDHPTQFGTGQKPELAYKQFISADGKYWITYDGQGNPAIANRVSNKVGTGKPGYSDSEIDLMSRYYSGQGDRAELERQLHNLAVVRTGTGRLVDGDGNWASGTPVSVGGAQDWKGLDTSANTNQDRAALQDILDRINAGQVSGTPTVVPVTQVPDNNRQRPVGGGIAGGGYPSGGGNGGGGYPSGGSGGGMLPSGGTGGDDLSQLLRQSYEENLRAQLAALQAAYQQNVAQYQAHDGLLSQSYRDQRNRAAAQNDLQRMYMAELGAMQGLNTGATGQLALAQSAAYQGGLADLWAAENQDRAENDLAMRNLAAGYQGDMASAAAKSNAQLAQALYGEYVRQIEAAEAARQAQLEQERWLAQFQYQQAQDDWDRQKWQTQWDASQQADRQGNAYKLAYTMLQNGIMPDGGTLDTAGISRADAQAIVGMYASRLAARAGTGSGGSSRGSGGGQVHNGAATVAGAEDVKSGTSGGELTFHADAFARTLGEQLSSWGTERAVYYLDSLWDTLTESQKKEAKRILGRYGYTYDRK